MKILLVMYSDLEANSAVHADALARLLAAHGHVLTIAIPDGPARASRFRDCPYAVRRFGEIRSGDDLPGGIPDIIHAWTPRESLREWVCSLCERWPSSRLVVHLEDNEEFLTRRQVGDLAYRLAAAGFDSDPIPRQRTHPSLGREMLSRADGCTLIIAALARQVPLGCPYVVIWPGSDDTAFHPRPPDPTLREKLGVPSSHLLVAYPGTTHYANGHEVESLCLAIALLNRNGIPTTLIRTGRDFSQTQAGEASYLHRHVRHLGYLSSAQRIGELLAACDILVQPGAPGPFNDLRFPAKIPDFLASGRPVILPRSNIGLELQHGSDAWVLDGADATNIAQALITIHENPALAQRLASGGRRFYEQHLRWEYAARRLESFYAKVLAAGAVVAKGGSRVSLSNPPQTRS